MKKASSITIVIILLFAISCSKIIEVDFPEQEQKLVIESLFCPDSTFRVFVSKTTGFNDSNIYFIDDATCKLYANNEFLFELQYQDSGFYAAPINYKPVPGVLYKLEVSHSDLPDVWAEDSVPSEIPLFRNFKVEDSVMYDVDAMSQYLSKLNFELIDNPLIKNFYELTITDRGDSTKYENDTTITSSGDTIINSCISSNYSYPEHIFGTDPVLRNENLLDFYPLFVPFSDNIITNSHIFEILFYQPLKTVYIFDENTNSNINKEVGLYYTLFVKLRSVSEAYYNYRKKLILHENNQQGDFWTG
ncbi:MAG: DUF4249 domain-containing protein, partial [Bacteroidales bacterium]|nr:DUF4249 domain-containing protein [Bacteroidales bacterium]